MIICIEIIRELEEKAVEHLETEYMPTKDKIIEHIQDIGYKFDKNYDEVEYYQVSK